MYASPSSQITMLADQNQRSVHADKGGVCLTFHGGLTHRQAGMKFMAHISIMQVVKASEPCKFKGRPL